jgi:hypothetical protein
MISVGATTDSSRVNEIRKIGSVLKATQVRQPFNILQPHNFYILCPAPNFQYELSLPLDGNYATQIHLALDCPLA